MTLAAGTRLGPYEILSPIGAGGMGEVYRARDTKLGREIAIKVLPGDLASDPARRQRFEQEARSASALNHPNILTIHDIAEADGTLYIAMELVEGKTLRELIMSGDPLATRKLLDIAVQTADGLSKAHSAGIVHRDLKPENVMVSKDGYVKILDFGLAKLTEAVSEEASVAPTAIAAPTQPGTVMGTAGYMSPEQASGQPVDFRSDQFSLGAIFYEMATGKRAFQRKTGAETLAAIIRDEPDPLSQAAPKAPAPVRWIVERCLAKDAEERYASTKDLARDLGSIRDHLSETSASGGLEAAAAAPRQRRVAAWVAAAALAVGLVGGVLADRRLTRSEPPFLKQLTFRRGEVYSARFAPDGQTVFYSAAWGGKPMEIFVADPQSPESRPFGLSAAEVLAISKSGQLAVSLNRHPVAGFMRSGTLTQLSVAGGAAPRDILEDVEWADWAPDGKSLAVVRLNGDRMQLEYPAKKVLYGTTEGWISHARVSPAGDLVAFVDHPVFQDDAGSIAVVDPSGKKKVLAGPFSTAQGLAWSTSGEVWFTAAQSGGSRSLYSATLTGKVRMRERVAGSLTLQDISRDGRILVTRDTARSEILARPPGESSERDLTWLDWAVRPHISTDGRMLLFSEEAEGGGAGYSVYLRKTDGSPAVRLGEGAAVALSPDGKWALAVVHPTSDPQLVAYPTGAGEPRLFPRDGLAVFPMACWMPDGKRIVFTANEAGHKLRVYLRDFNGGKPHALTPEGYFSGAVTPDGEWAVTSGPDQKYYLYPISGGEPNEIPGLGAEDDFAGVGLDSHFLYAFRRGEVPVNVYRVEVASGQKQLWRTLMPADAAGVSYINPVFTPSGESYGYSYHRTLSDLYIVSGVR